MNPFHEINEYLELDSGKINPHIRRIATPTKESVMPFAHYPEFSRAFFTVKSEGKSSLTRVIERLAALNAAFERPSK